MARPSAPRSPWQNAFVERLIGSIRRECLDHVIVWNERALRRHLRDYVACYHQWRTDLSIDEDSPLSRAAEIPNGRPIVAVPHVGGLHYHYQRLAA
jgi:transposase InsO family protein